MPGPVTTRDVNTTLEYWKPAPGNKVTIDFTQPGAEQQFDKLAEAKDPRDVTISDVRGHEDSFSLDHNGFQYVNHAVPGLETCTSEEDFAKCSYLLPKSSSATCRTGATKVVSFTHRVRSKITDSNKREENKSPALAVHTDFSPEGAWNHLPNVIKDESERSELLKGRVMIINVWRPLKTITRDPLAVVDWNTVDPQKNFTRQHFKFEKHWHELGQLTYNNEHKWYYLNKQEPSEPLVFKQFDSDAPAGKGGFTVGHSAFVDPEYTDAPARESMEIKMFAFVPKA